MASRRRAAPLLVGLAIAAAASAGCGRAGDDGTSGKAVVEAPSIPISATKNTSRIPGGGPVELAAGSARAVYPGAGQRPPAVALADASSWPAAVTAASLMAPPLRAPVLLTQGSEIPAPTAAAIEELSPATGKLLRLGTAGAPDGLETVSIGGADPYTLAQNVDAYRAKLTGRWSRSVVVVPVDSPAYAMPAAAWAAKSGDPVLFTGKDSLPAATAAAIRSHGKPKIYLLGPASVISPGSPTSFGSSGALPGLAAGRRPPAPWPSPASHSRGSAGA